MISERDKTVLYAISNPVDFLISDCLLPMSNARAVLQASGIPLPFDSSISCSLVDFMKRQSTFLPSTMAQVNNLQARQYAAGAYIFINHMDKSPKITLHLAAMLIASEGRRSKHIYSFSLPT
ncbi:uncharacterized protein G2W53_011972 [Senna tora]|uniref:Uncharacterized protein n=1 Tax=Senna tora TaxID=362788 RepID=A0A834WSH1_9FABA|nr:uncharacterized protein G2W53_011972 [Senna tora]